MTAPVNFRNEYLVEQVHQHISLGDMDRLRRFLEKKFPLNTLMYLAAKGDVETRRAAVTSLGAVANSDAVPTLIISLRDEDKELTALAEEALWQVWFNSGNSMVNQLMEDIATDIRNRTFDSAMTSVETVIALDTNFAEGYNQRAIIHFFLGNWDHAIADCETTLSLNDVHFGALAGMGHCLIEKGHLRSALSCYDRALAINPTLKSIYHNANHIRTVLARRDS